MNGYSLRASHKGLLLLPRLDPGGATYSKFTGPYGVIRVALLSLTPWTLSSKTSWTKTHRLGRWVFIVEGWWSLLLAVVRRNAARRGRLTRTSGASSGRVSPMILHDFPVDARVALTIGGSRALDLAETYGTPLLVIDEGRFRENCRAYRDNLRAAYPAASRSLPRRRSASWRRAG